MEKEFLPYELALRLKKIGFDEPCLKSVYYRTMDNQRMEGITDSGIRNSSGTCRRDDRAAAIPTWQSAFSWAISQIDDEYKVCFDENGWYAYNLENQIFRGKDALEKILEIVESNRNSRI